MTPAASVGLAEAKNKLSELLDRVERGEEITITRHDEAIARLIPAKRSSRNEVERAIAAMRELRARSPRKVTVEEIVAWKNEGRP